MNKLIATTLENKVHLWDLREQHPKEGFASHSYAHDRLLRIIDFPNTSWIDNQLIKYSCGYSTAAVLYSYIIYLRMFDFDANLYLCQ